jgi:hypothetical protein
VRSGELIVRYHERDVPHIEPLLVYLTQVAGEVSADLRYVTSASKLVVYFAPDLVGCGSCLDVESPPPSSTKIILPSPWLSGIPADGLWEEATLRSLRYGVAYALASNAMRADNQPGLALLQKALVDEYAAWYSQGQDAAHAPLLGRIVKRHGREVLPRVFLSLKGAHLSTLFVVRWLSLNPSADPVAYFECLLNVEREAILAGRKDTFMLFQDPGWMEEQERFYARVRSTARPLLHPTVYVEEVEMVGDHALVTLREPVPLLQGLRTSELVEYETMSSGGSPSFGALVQRPVGPFAFYRRQEGDWEWKRASRAEAAVWGIPSIRASSSHAVGEWEALGGGD